VSAAIVTCGGLCPGLNDVVQNIVFTLTDYGVPEDQILGIRYGLRGFYERQSKPLVLSRSIVDGIHLKGGTVLVCNHLLLPLLLLLLLLLLRLRLRLAIATIVLRGPRLWLQARLWTALHSRR
jgi:hypothetical protein